MANKLQTTIEMLKSGQSVPIVSLTREAPHRAAALSKTVDARNKMHHQYDNKGNRTIDANAVAGFNKISREVSQRTKDFRAMMDLFPETELAAQILVSCVISPRDMTKGEVNIIVTNTLKSEKLTGLMLEAVKEYFDKDYKIKPLLPKILRNVLIEQGSDPHIVLPENTIDDLINGSSQIKFEHISPFIDAKYGTFKHYGILGNPVQAPASTNHVNYIQESFTAAPAAKYNPRVVLDPKKPEWRFNNNLVVIDNPDVLRLPQIIDQRNKQKTANQLDAHNDKASNLYKTYVNEGYSEENFSKNPDRKLSDRELMSLLYKNKHNAVTPIAKARPDDELARLTIGAPLVLRAPPEAVMPVYTPGNEEKHIGYFLLLDADGNPLTMNSNNQYVSEMTQNLNASNDMNSYMLQRGSQAFLGKDCKTVNVAQATRIYTDIVESDMLARVRNGVIGRQVALVKNEDVYRLMLARHLANQMTQVLYIPMELMTYFAYRYDQNGIGVSMLDGAKSINMMRSVMLVSKMMNQVKNAIGRTDVQVNLDADDTDPDGTMEDVVHEFMRLRQSNFPSGINSPADIADWVSKAGYRFTPKGHPGLPELEIEITETQTNYSEGNDGMEDELRKRSIMTLGVPPEAVDNGFAGDFATSVVANNLLLAKRVMDIQEVMVPQLTDHMRKVARADGNLLEKLKDIVRKNYEDLFKDIKDNDELNRFRDNKEMVVQLIISEFLSNFEASLPTPDSGTIENLNTAFEAYMQGVEAALKHWISSEVITAEFAGESAMKADEVMTMFRSYFARKWMQENSFLPEISTTFEAITGMDTAADRALNEQIHHVHDITRLIVRFMKEAKPVANAADTDISLITGGEPLTDSAAGSLGSSGGSDMGGGGGGGDPFGGGGFDMPSFEEPKSGLEGPDDKESEEPKDGNPEDPNAQQGNEDPNGEGPGDLPDLASLN